MDLVGKHDEAWVFGSMDVLIDILHNAGARLTNGIFSGAFSLKAIVETSVIRVGRPQDSTKTEHIVCNGTDTIINVSLRRTPQVGECSRCGRRLLAWSKQGNRGLAHLWRHSVAGETRYEPRAVHQLS